MICELVRGADEFGFFIGIFFTWLRFDITTRYYCATRYDTGLLTATRLFLCLPSGSDTARRTSTSTSTSGMQKWFTWDERERDGRLNVLYRSTLDAGCTAFRADELAWSTLLSTSTFDAIRIRIPICMGHHILDDDDACHRSSRMMLIRRCRCEQAWRMYALQEAQGAFFFSALRVENL